MPPPDANAAPVVRAQVCCHVAARAPPATGRGHCPPGPCRSPVETHAEPDRPRRLERRRRGASPVFTRGSRADARGAGRRPDPGCETAASLPHPSGRRTSIPQISIVDSIGARRACAAIWVRRAPWRCRCLLNGHCGLFLAGADPSNGLCRSAPNLASRLGDGRCGRHMTSLLHDGSDSDDSSDDAGGLLVAFGPALAQGG